MTNSGFFKHLKQTKDPTIIHGLNQYIRLCAKSGETQAKIEFVDGCMEKCEYPRQYSKIPKRNRINVTTSSLKRQADNEKETYCSA